MTEIEIGDRFGVHDHSDLEITGLHEVFGDVTEATLEGKVYGEDRTMTASAKALRNAKEQGEAGKFVYLG